MGGEAIKVIDRFSELIIDAPIGAGMLTYFMINTASDIGGAYKQMVSTGNYTPAAKASIVTAGTSTGTVVGIFATNLGAPNIAFIPDGVFHLHVHALKGAAGGATLYGEIHKRDAGGIETLLWTSGSSVALTTSETEYDLVVNTIAGADISVTDRLVIKFKVIVTSGTPDITLYFDGTGLNQTNSRTEIPSSAIDDSLLVHKAGAETITGVKTFAASPIVPAGATGTQVPQSQEVATLARQNYYTEDNVYLAPVVATSDLMALNPTPIASYTASQSGTTVTATVGTFSAADVGRIFVWTTAAILYVRISAYISPTQVTVDHSETIVSQAGTTYGPPLLYVDPVAPAIYSDLTAKTTPIDADTIIMNDSAATNIWKTITFANIWTWITTKMSGVGLSVIVKFLTYIWFPSAGLISQYGDPAMDSPVREYFDVHANLIGGKTIVSATYAAGFITYNVIGHGLPASITTEKVTTVCSPAGFSFNKAAPVYVDANNFKIASTDPGVAFVSGTEYTLNLCELLQVFNSALDTATGIFGVRPFAGVTWLKITSETGILSFYIDIATTVGTVPAWGNSIFYIDKGGSAFYYELRSWSVFRHATNITMLNKAVSGWLPWVTRTTTGAEAALQLAYIELINFVSVTLPAIVAGRLEWDGTDLWFSESATVRSPINNTKYLINAQVGTTYTFVLADKGYLVSFANAAAITATVPPNSSVAFPVGTRIRVIQDGAGKLTIAAGVGVTINSLAGNKAMAGQYSDAELVKEATDTWYLTGNLIA